MSVAEPFEDGREAGDGRLERERPRERRRAWPELRTHLARARDEARRRLVAHTLGFKLLALALVARAPRQYLLRRALARRRGGTPRCPVPDEVGFRRFTPDDVAGIAPAVATLQRVARELAPHYQELADHQHGRYRIVFDLLSDEQLLDLPELVDFTLDDAFLEAAIAYLGTVPVLRRIGLGLALPDPAHPAPRNSQLFHIDGDDRRQLKLFMAVEPVGPGDGAFTYLPAHVTQRVLAAIPGGRRRGYSYEYFADEEVLPHIAPHELQRLEGPPGTALLIDTSRCLHYGSRVEPGHRRLMLGTFYQRYHVINETPSNWLDPACAGADAVRRLALSPRRVHPPGYFFPHPRRHPGPGARGRT